VSRKPFDKAKIEEMAASRPYALMVIQTQILYDIAGMLEDMGEEIAQLRGEWRQTVSEGVFRPLTVHVTSEITTLDPSKVDTMPWMGFDIYNDGPAPVYMMVNEEYLQEKTPLNAGESLKVDMKKRQVAKITLHCPAGQEADVRIFAAR
jgi:hypothetical protein